MAGSPQKKPRTSQVALVMVAVSKVAELAQQGEHTDTHLLSWKAFCCNVVKLQPRMGRQASHSSLVTNLECLKWLAGTLRQPRLVLHCWLLMRSVKLVVFQLGWTIFMWSVWVTRSRWWSCSRRRDQLSASREKCSLIQRLRWSWISQFWSTASRSLSRIFVAKWSKWAALGPQVLLEVCYGGFPHVSASSVLLPFQYLCLFTATSSPHFVFFLYLYFQSDMSATFVPMHLHLAPRMHQTTSLTTVPHQCSCYGRVLARLLNSRARSCASKAAEQQSSLTSAVCETLQHHGSEGFLQMQTMV